MFFDHLSGYLMKNQLYLPEIDMKLLIVTSNSSETIPMQALLANLTSREGDIRPG